MKPNFCKCGKQIARQAHRCVACYRIDRPAYHKKKAVQLPEDSPRSTWDTEVIDFNGKQVWALDLADQFRLELIRRGKHR